MNGSDSFPFKNNFESRHLGVNAQQKEELLAAIGVASIEELIGSTVPSDIRMKRELNLAPALSETEVLEKLKKIAKKNRVFRSYIGTGYVDTHVPTVILRNVLENPGWYTQYTPYQAEIAQGRLEALLNFQTMVMDFTAFDIANASLLDEATAAAEAMAMSYSIQGKDPSRAFFISSECHPQTIAVVETRAKYLGIRTLVGEVADFDFATPVFGALLQYPTSLGEVVDYTTWIKKAHDAKALVTMACDLMSLA